ncbi:MAG: pyruvate kinase, partial [Paracoccaceae bacterium]
MKRDRNVKIVATLGPASSSYEMIKDLHLAGADVFRLNMSHGTHDDITERHRLIRQVEKEFNSPIGILADLQGPKLRVGVFGEGPVDLEEGASFRLDLEEAPGSAERVQLPHPEIFAALKAGAHLLINDGKIRLRVESCGPDFAQCTVIAGGMISDRKGVNVPDVVLPLAALSEKDKTDLEFVCNLGVDWLALSFVQRPQDLMEARELADGRAAILSKIEKPSAVQHFEEILNVSDGIMVARGDLGVELPPEDVPGWQKKIIAECRLVGKPVVVATQMLESMITSPTPTRAEASDVAGAVFDGADAVMLSAETAVGQFPVESVQIMSRIVAAAELHIAGNPEAAPAKLPTEPSLYHAVALATVSLAETVGAEVIIAFSTSGNTAVRIARERPGIPFFVLSPFIDVRRRLAILWGTQTAASTITEDFEAAIAEGVQEITSREIAAAGSHAVIVAGMPFGIAGTTNSLRVIML